jgi:hypothetical protein
MSKQFVTSMERRPDGLLNVTAIDEETGVETIYEGCYAKSIQFKGDLPSEVYLFHSSNDNLLTVIHCAKYFDRNGVASQSTSVDLNSPLQVIDSGLN